MNEPHVLQLRTGRTVRLRSLNQWGVYEGLLEGLPTRQMNQKRIESTLEEEKRTHPHHALHLIAPREKPLPQPFKDRPYPFGEPAALPSIVCVARFASLDHARNPAMDYSELVVIWFQEQFAFPIDPQILKQLRDLEWERLALDYEY